MTILDKAVIDVNNGAKFHVDFENKSAKVNGKFLIENGKYDGDLGIEEISQEAALNQLFTLYIRYKYSVPSEATDKRPSKYFKPLPYSELSDNDLMYGVSRSVSQFVLEFVFLVLVLNGSLKWNPDWGSYFYKHPSADDLIILKQWM